MHFQLTWVVTCLLFAALSNVALAQCVVTVVDGATTMPAAGGTTPPFHVSFNQPDCEWTAASADATLTTSSGTGNGSFAVTLAPNNGRAPRTITVTVTPQDNPAGVVTLTITQAAGTLGCTVPNVVGQPQFVAQQALTAAGFTVGTITEEESCAIPRGLVIRQDPANGETGDCGTAVSLVVATCPLVANIEVAATVAGGNFVGSVATGPGCNWVATASEPWIRFDLGTGTGSGSVIVAVDFNPGAARTGTITFAIGDADTTATVQVTQEGLPVSEPPASGCGFKAARALKSITGDLFLFGAAIFVLLAMTRFGRQG